MKKRSAEEQIVQILRQAEASGMQIQELCSKHNATEQTFFRSCNKYGCREAANARRLKELKSENAKLKHLVTEQLGDRRPELHGRLAGHESMPSVRRPWGQLGLNLLKRRP